MSHGSRGEFPNQMGQEQHGEGKRTNFDTDPKKTKTSSNEKSARKRLMLLTNTPPKSIFRGEAVFWP